MNLVCKEFVASRVDGDGVLVLSEFAGAAVELGSAVLTNPFSNRSMENSPSSVGWSCTSRTSPEGNFTIAGPVVSLMV
jgi:hypothetical protein